MRVKKKALVLAVYMVCTTPNIGITQTSVSALNLGEVESYSNLGEPFKGIIPIQFTTMKQAQQLRIRLAPRSVFSRLGTEKAEELQYLKFHIKSLKNKPVIVVSSTRPIHSPILNFILEIESPAGIAYQDYTVMLDPPRSTTKIAKHASKPSVKANRLTVKPLLKSKRTQSKHYVKAGDTLSMIALQHKHTGISLKKMILGIYYSNPDAFSQNNLNKIKKGVVLKIPSIKKIKRILKSHKRAINDTNLKAYKSNQSKTLRDYKVKRGDTLSHITKKYIYRGVSFSRMMKSIFKANPSAFSKNKMNILYAGAYLRIPTYTEVIKKQHSSIAESANTTVSDSLSRTSHESKSQEVSKPKLQAVFKSVLEKEPKTASTQQKNKPLNIARISENTLAKVVTKTVTSANIAEEELIQTLKNSNTTIKNLQKRIRKLRGNLSSITSDYENLSEMLADKSFLQQLQKQQNKKPILTLITEYKNQDHVEKDLDRLTIPISTNNQTKQNNSALKNNLNTKFELSEIFALGDNSYIILALLLGMLLIRYRENIYAYDSIPNDQPNFYPPAQENISEAEKELLNFSEILSASNDNDENSTRNQSTQVETKFSTETLLPKIPSIPTKEVPPSGDKEKHTEISEESLQECELLIDELILELSKKTKEKAKPEQLDSKYNHLTDIELKTPSINNSTQKEVFPLFKERFTYQKKN